MRHLKSGRKLNRTASHRKALFSNLSCSLIKHKQITTTLPKAKELQKFVERLVTYAKKGNLHGRRLIMKRIKGKLKKEISNILIHDIAPQYSDRNGGYTRIIKLANRKNDNSKLSLIEFVDLHLDKDNDNEEINDESKNEAIDKDKK
tara:strand:+ start:241 stop:681 length:441 start_codon:yes stop_codon:yes gene_type:complete